MWLVFLEKRTYNSSLGIFEAGITEPTDFFDDAHRIESLARNLCVWKQLD